MRVLAFDVGGTRLKAGIVEGGAIERVHLFEAPGRVDGASFGAMLRQIANEVRGGDVEGIGVCVPGVVQDGVVVSLPGKLSGLESTDVGAIVRSSFPKAATAVVNDAMAYATGEAVAGAGAGAHRVVVMTIGTGVGTTLVVDGVPDPASILGGFIPIAGDEEGPVDSIGRADTIEALCRAERIGADPAATFEAWARADAAARDAVASYRKAIVRAVAALASAHAPEVVVLGGGPMVETNPITPGLEDEVNARMYGSYRVVVRIASLGDAAALVGLARMVEAAA